MLNYAEAMANAFSPSYKDGDKYPISALDAVNELRRRSDVDMPSYPDNISKEDFIKRLKNERRVELAFEGHRYWDVRRWRTATTELSRSFSGLRYILDYSSYMNGEKKYKLEILDNIDGSVSTPLFKEENYYLPITLSRTSSNPNMVENPGYE